MGLTAALPRSGDIPPAISTMHDSSHDPHQNVFRWILTSVNGGCISSYSRKGGLKFIVASLYPFRNHATYTIPQDVSQTAQMHLLYTRFRSVSAPLSPLLGELERRANAHPDELSSLLAECHAAYFWARKGLLVGRLVEEIKGLDPGRTELVELVSYLCHVYYYWYVFLYL